MKMKTPDSCSHNPNTNPTTQDAAPITIRSDLAATSDYLVDVREAKRMLKTVSAQKALLQLRKGTSAVYSPSGKTVFLGGSSPALAPQD